MEMTQTFAKRNGHASAFRRFVAIAALLAFGLALGACARGKGPQDDYQLAFRLNSDTYRPGEVVVANVRVTNASGGSLQSRAMNYDSVKFYLVPKDKQTLAVQHEAAHSLKEEMPIWRLRSGDLPDGRSMSRTMVFLTMTEEPGEYTVKASYNPNPPPAPGAKESGDTEARPTIWSDSTSEITVEGDRLFSRDSNGFLERGEAIRLAASKLGRPYSESDAVMFIDPELGNLQWWVSLTAHPSTLKPGEQPRQAFFVDPYRGRVKGRAPLQKPVEAEGEMRVTPHSQEAAELPEADDIIIVGD